MVAQFGGWAGGRFHRDPAAIIDHFGRVLDLTDAQKQTATSLFNDAKAQAEPIVAQLKQGHESMAAAIKTNKSDAEINDIAGKQGASDRSTSRHSLEGDGEILRAIDARTEDQGGRYPRSHQSSIHGSFASCPVVIGELLSSPRRRSNPWKEGSSSAAL